MSNSSSGNSGPPKKFEFKVPSVPPRLPQKLVIRSPNPPIPNNRPSTGKPHTVPTSVPALASNPPRPPPEVIDLIDDDDDEWCRTMVLPPEASLPPPQLPKSKSTQRPAATKAKSQTQLHQWLQPRGGGSSVKPTSPSSVQKQQSQRWTFSSQRTPSEEVRSTQGQRQAGFGIGTQGKDRNEDEQVQAESEVAANFKLASEQDPWVKKYPLQELVPIMFRNTAKSLYLELDKRIEAADKCLSYLDDIRKTEAFAKYGHISESPISHELKHVLDTFELFIQRLRKAKLNELQTADFETLLQRTWNYHVTGEIDFRGTPILNLLLQYSPKLMEDTLACLMKMVLIPTSPKEVLLDMRPTQEFSTLVRLCQSNATAFQLVFDTLVNVWISTKCNSRVTQFFEQFVEAIVTTAINQDNPPTKTEINSLFPTMFHPILYFLSAIEEHHDNKPAVTTLSNSASTEIQIELLTLINQLIGTKSLCDDAEFRHVSFFLSSNSTLSKFISKSYQSRLITCRDFGFLWTAIYNKYL